MFHNHENEKPYWEERDHLFSWFPSPFAECNNSRKKKDQKCGFYLYDYFKNPYLKTDLNGKKYEFFAAVDDDIKNSFAKYGLLTKEEEEY